MYKKKVGPRYTPCHERVMQRTKIPMDDQGLPDKSKCWDWTGPINNAGFGMIKGDSSLGDPKMVTVHRVIARQKGLYIKFKEVQHTCLNKICVNPDHLVIGTAKQRNTRIIDKHGKNFMSPKVPYVTCKHCKKTCHVVWFSRKHKDCYPGMLGKYSQFTCDKV